MHRKKPFNNWLRLPQKQDKPAAGKPTINEREEFERLSRENRQLLMEREILSSRGLVRSIRRKAVG
jgi:transposase-like protein